MLTVISRAEWDATPAGKRRGVLPNYPHFAGGSRLAYDVRQAGTQILRTYPGGDRPEWLPALIDDKDAELLAGYVAALGKMPGYRVGDYVEFPGGETRRISYIWPDDPPSVQTSAPRAGFSIGTYGVSMGNGSLYRSVPGDTLTDTGRVAAGSVWFPHHGHLEADCAVDTWAEFRVYSCSREAPKV